MELRRARAGAPLTSSSTPSCFIPWPDWFWGLVVGISAAPAPVAQLVRLFTFRCLALRVGAPWRHRGLVAGPSWLERQADRSCGLLCGFPGAGARPGTSLGDFGRGTGAPPSRSTSTESLTSAGLILDALRAPALAYGPGGEGLSLLHKILYRSLLRAQKNLCIPDPPGRRSVIGAFLRIFVEIVCGQEEHPASVGSALSSPGFLDPMNPVEDTGGICWITPPCPVILRAISFELRQTISAPAAIGRRRHDA
jgi:hypothetical protein